MGLTAEGVMRRLVLLWSSKRKKERERGEARRARECGEGERKSSCLLCAPRQLVTKDEGVSLLSGEEGRTERERERDGREDLCEVPRSLLPFCRLAGRRRRALSVSLPRRRKTHWSKRRRRRRGTAEAKAHHPLFFSGSSYKELRLAFLPS